MNNQNLDQNENKPTKSKKRVPNWGHIIPFSVGAVILIVGLVLIIRILIWNRGQVSIIDPNEVPDVSTETEDMMYLMPPSTVWGAEDDGEVNIAVFGNDTYATEYKGKTIMDMVNEDLNVNIYNICFPGSYLSSETEGVFDAEENPVNAFSFYWLQSNFLTRDYKLQRKALEFLPEGYDKKTYEQTLTELESIDFSKIDVLLICYDGHDYLAGRTPDIYGEVYNVSTMQGSIAASIFNMEQNYPNLQYVFVAPVFCYYIDEAGNKEGCDTKDLGQGNMPTGLTPIHNLDAVYTLSYLDLFYGVKINLETAEGLLTEDGITPNEKGAKMMAERIVRMLKGRL